MAAARVIPATYRKLVVQKLTNKFREAIQIVTVPTPELGPGEILVRNRYAGINASDINFTAGRYDTTAKPPFDAGFEGLGEVVAIGPNTKKIQVGQPVAYVQYGAFSEYTTISAKMAIPIPKVQAEFLPMLVSGMTASIALDKTGEIKSGETVLVTAAAGGTGQIAVQWAKLAGCHVIGTCSSDEKVQFLKSIGCDRAINYTTENLNAVLKTEYPNGVDVVYESVGGETFEICLNRLAVKGRLIVIGYISGYESELGMKRSKLDTLPIKLLAKSASVKGFFMNHFFNEIKIYLPRMIELFMGGRIKLAVDNGINHTKGPFKGVDSIEDAVEYLYSRKSKGKIVVEFPEHVESKL